MLGPKTRVEKCRNAASRIDRGLFNIGDSGEGKSLEPEGLVVVQKRMGAIPMLLGVIGVIRLLECPLQIGRPRLGFTGPWRCNWRRWDTRWRAGHRYIRQPFP